MTGRPRFLRLVLGALAATLLVAGAGSAKAHDGSLGNEVMWEACDTRQIDEPCTFLNDVHDTYRGTCQQMADDLVCVRNQPIEYASTQIHEHEAAAATPVPKAGNPSVLMSVGIALLLAGVLLLFGLAIKHCVERNRRARRPGD